MKRLLFVGIAGATATLVHFNKDRLFGTDAPTTIQARSVVLETAEFTIPIPSGYRALSREELLARVAKAERNSPTGALVATLVNDAHHSAIGIARIPRSTADAPPIPATSQDCTRAATLYADRLNRRVIAGGTLVEYPRDGLGTACQFTLGSEDGHATQVMTYEWVFSCFHPPDQGADCRQVATGFRRRVQ